MGSVWRTNTKSLTEFLKTACSISQRSAVVCICCRGKNRPTFLLSFLLLQIPKNARATNPASLVFDITYYLNQIFGRFRYIGTTANRHHIVGLASSNTGKKFCEMILNSAIKSRARSETYCCYVCMLSRKKFHLTKMKV